MLRVIFDTNIYGLLIEEDDWLQLEQKIEADKGFIVYGYQPIRKELRDIRKATKISKKIRIAVLSLYDKITEHHFLKDSINVTNLAKKYYDSYRNFGGIYNWDTNIRIDFMIVACASYYALDVIYSGDNKTLLGKSALKAYKHINLKENLRSPNFLKYEDLLKKLRNEL